MDAEYLWPVNCWEPVYVIYECLFVASSVRQDVLPQMFRRVGQPCQVGLKSSNCVVIDQGAKEFLGYQLILLIGNLASIIDAADGVFDQAQGLWYFLFQLCPLRCR